MKLQQHQASVRNGGNSKLEGEMAEEEGRGKIRQSLKKKKEKKRRKKWRMGGRAIFLSSLSPSLS